MCYDFQSGFISTVQNHTQKTIISTQWCEQQLFVLCWQRLEKSSCLILNSSDNYVLVQILQFDPRYTLYILLRERKVCWGTMPVSILPLCVHKLSVYIFLHLGVVLAKVTKLMSSHFKRIIWNSFSTGTTPPCVNLPGSFSGEYSLFSVPKP